MKWSNIIQFKLFYYKENFLSFPIINIVAANKRKNKKKDKSIIPVIFTIGVIGWGFFAIDRLTEPYISKNNLNSGQPVSKNINANGYKQPVFFKALESAFTSLKTNKQKITEESKITEQEHLPVIPETKLNLSLLDQKYSNEEPFIDKTEPAIDNFKTENHQLTSNKQTYKLYFYQELPSGELKLTEITKTANEKVSLIEIYADLIKGPENRPENKNFADTFIIKPALINVSRNDKTIVLNFNDSFGHGVSFEMLQMQISQLLQTAKQFPSVESIKILINNKNVVSLGGDGLNVPEIINNETFPITMRN